MSPFAIFPWFLLFLIVTTTQPRRYGPLDGFWIPKCVTTGAQKTSVGSIGSKMEVKFQEIAIKFHILMHRYIYCLFEFDVSFLSGMAPFAPPPAVKHLVSSSERSIWFGVPLPLSAWGAPYRQASLSHWGRAWNQQVLVDVVLFKVKICEMEINGTKLRICSVWTRNPLQRLWVVFWFGGEHSVSKGNKKTLLLRSKCFSGHEKMFTCAWTWQRRTKVYEWKSTITMSSLLRHPPTPSGKSHVQLDTQHWDSECSAGAHLANIQLRSSSMKSLHGLVLF